MFNMLIAIMADVFEDLTEKRHVKAISTKLQILAAQAPVLAKTSKTEEQDVFMIVIDPIKGDDYDDDTWHGTI